LDEIITRKEFEVINADLFQLIPNGLNQVLRDSGLKKSQISRVIISGGSSRIPRVIQDIENFFGDKSLFTLTPDESIAFGSVIANITSRSISEARNAL
jgi:molecular chaperone DnaK (HSP70)